MSLLREAPKQNTGWTFSVRPQVLLLCREQAPWTTSPLFSGTTSLLAKDPASGPAAHLPQQSPQKGVSWWHQCLAPAPPPWRMLSRSARAVTPTGRHHHHRLSSRQSTEPRNNMLCAVSHLHSDPGQAPASPRSCASGSYSRNLPANEGARLSHLHCSKGSELAALTDPFRL